MNARRVSLVVSVALLVAGIGAMAMAQERVEDTRLDGECLPLRMPGIAEPAEEYDAYVRLIGDGCQREIEPLVRSSSVPDIGEVYRGFIENKSPR